jgi:hypothetical protein
MLFTSCNHCHSPQKAFGNTIGVGDPRYIQCWNNRLRRYKSEGATVVNDDNGLIILKLSALSKAPRVIWVPSNSLVRCWVKEIAVIWNESLAVAELGLWSIIKQQQQQWWKRQQKSPGGQGQWVFCLLVCLNGFNVCEHYKAIDDRSQFKVHTDERTRVHNSLGSLEVHPSKY